MRLRRWTCAGILFGSLTLATPAWSQTYVGVTPPAVASNQAAQDPPVTTAPVSRGNLAVTGADILELIAIGALGMSAGAVTMRMTRERATPAIA